MKKESRKILFSKYIIRALAGVAFFKPGITKLEYETLNRIFWDKEEIVERKKIEKVTQIKKAS